MLGPCIYLVTFLIFQQYTAEDNLKNMIS